MRSQTQIERRKNQGGKRKRKGKNTQRLFLSRTKQVSSLFLFLSYDFLIIPKGKRETNFQNIQTCYSPFNFFHWKVFKPFLPFLIRKLAGNLDAGEQNRVRPKTFFLGGTKRDKAGRIRKVLSLSLDLCQQSLPPLKIVRGDFLFGHFAKEGETIQAL